jgi:acyl-CoA dehydrogenase
MYSFEPDEEQKMLIDVIHRYAVQDLRPASREAGDVDIPPLDLIEKGWELGTIQASVPDEYGGFGDHATLTGVLALEEMAYGDAACAIAVNTPALFVYAVLLAGNQDQKIAYLPPVLDANWRPLTAALIEPSFNFDPGDLSAVATPAGNNYRISGQKAYVPYAEQAEMMIVYARLEDQTQGFLVHRSTPGLMIEQREGVLGFDTLPLYRVCLDQVEVPFENRLGGPGGHSFEPICASYRLANAALAIGVSRAAFEYSRDYAKEREVFGVKVAQKQAIAFMLAEMATEIEAARLLLWEAAWMFDRQKDGWAKQAYLADLSAADMAMMVTDRAVQILGGHGYIREHPVELWMRYGRGFASLAGLAMV